MRRSVDGLRLTAHEATPGRFKHKAFTLVEVLVSIVISAMLLTLVLGSFWLLININQRNEMAGELQRQTTFALVRIADKVKQYSVDYESYQHSATGICQNLSLESGTQERLCLGNDHQFQKDGETLRMDGQRLFGEKFIVEGLSFYVSPSKDPFSDIADQSIQLQPKVTVSLKVRSQKYPDIFQEVQTTISSRKYQE